MDPNKAWRRTGLRRRPRRKEAPATARRPPRGRRRTESLLRWELLPSAADFQFGQQDTSEGLQLQGRPERAAPLVRGPTSLERAPRALHHEDLVDLEALYTAADMAED